MKILFLHLSDAHISSDEDVNIRRIWKLVDSLNITKFDRCVLVFSGDLAHSGLYNEYKHVGHVFGNIISKLRNKYNHIKRIDSLIVPGNHDVNQTKNQKERKDFIKIKDKKKLNNEINNELSKMNPFFLFAKRNGCFKKNLVVDNRILNYDGYKIGVNLINTGVFSILKDEKGIHYLPSNYIDLLYNNMNVDLNISIMHHGPEWFMPDNKNELEKAIYRNSNFVFIGHEHDNEEINMEINDQYNVKIIRGGVYNDSFNKQISEYYTLIVDTKKNNYDLYFFSWDKDGGCYRHIIKSRNKKIIKNGLKPKKEFLKEFLIDEKHNISDNFTDYFVFPRIEKENKKLYSVEYELCYQDDFLKELEDNKKMLISGEENSGKTILLKSIYLSLYQKNKIPLFFNIDDIKNKRVDKMIKTVFEEQYSEKEIEYIKYQQIEKKYKAAIVDDINFIDKHCIKSFIIQLSEEFEYIILASNKGWNFDIKSEVKYELEIYDTFQRYRLTDFYSDKRLKLIENICVIKHPINITNIKEYSKKINDFIKNQIHLFNLDPDFIVQYTNYFCTNGYSYSSDSKIFSKIFEANIAKALEKYAEKGDVDRIFTLLNKIAYYIHFNKIYPLPFEEFKKIINEYNEEYIKYGQEIKPKILIDILGKAKIIQANDYYDFKFTNNSLLAYFVARELVSKFINEGYSTDLDYILNNICFGINGDIVLFISYLSSNPNILKHIYHNANEFMTDWSEFNLDKNNVEFLQKIYSNLEITLPTDEDKERINKQSIENEKIIKNDEYIKTVNIYNYDEADINLMINKLAKSLKYAQIIAKTLPNFEYMLKSKEKIEFVEAIYSIPNKILYYWLKNIDENLDEIISDICKLMNNNQEDENIDSENKARLFLEDITTAMILSLYDYIGSLATNPVTIMYLDSFDYKKNTNYEIQNLIMHEVMNDIEYFINKFNSIYDKTNKRIVKLMAKKIVWKHLLTHDEISYSNKQKLIGEHFSEKEKKHMLLKNASNY